MFHILEDHPDRPEFTGFRPKLETLENREAPTVFAINDLYTVRAGRTLNATNNFVFGGGGFFGGKNKGKNSGVLANDWDDTENNKAGIPQFGKNLTATLLTSPVDVQTGLQISTPFQFNQSGAGSFTFRAPRNFNGQVRFTYQANGPSGSSGSTTVNINVVGPTRRVAVGAGEGNAPRVDVWDATTKYPQFSFYAYDQGFTGGVRVATGDFNADNIDDLVTVTGKGGGPNVRIFDGTSGKMLSSFYAMDPNFTGGLNIATGDINGDGQDDIILGAERGGGPRVTVLDGTDFSVIADFYAYAPNFTGGVRVAAGDINGDGNLVVVTAPGFGGAPNVRAFDVNNGETTPFESFLAGDASDTRGLYLTSGDFNADYVDDIAVGSGAGAPEYRVYDGRDFSLMSSRNYGNTDQLPASVDPGTNPSNSGPIPKLQFGLNTGPGPTPSSIADTAAPPYAGSLQGFTGGLRVGVSYANRDNAADLIVASGVNEPGQMTVYGGGGTNAQLFTVTLADFLVFGGLTYGGLNPTGHQ